MSTKPLLESAATTYQTNAETTSPSDRCVITINKPASPLTAFAVFRRICAFVPTDDLPSLLSFSILCPPSRDVNISLVKQMIVDRYLSSQISHSPCTDTHQALRLDKAVLIGQAPQPAANENEGAKEEETRISNSRMLSAAQVTEHYFPFSLAASMSHKERIELFRKLRSSSRIAENDGDAEGLCKDTSTLHDYVILMRQLYQSVPMLTFEDFPPLLKSKAFDQASALFPSDVVQKAWKEVPFDQKAVQLGRQLSHLLRCSILLERMVKAWQAIPEETPENFRPVFVLPEHTSSTYRQLLSNPNSKRWFWRLRELGELLNRHVFYDKKLNQEVVTKPDETSHLLCYLPPKKGDRTSTGIRAFVAKHTGVYKAIIAVTATAFAFLIPFLIISRIQDANAMSILRCLWDEDEESCTCNSYSAWDPLINAWNNLPKIHYGPEEGLPKMTAEAINQLLPLAKKCSILQLFILYFPPSFSACLVLLLLFMSNSLCHPLEKYFYK